MSNITPEGQPSNGPENQGFDAQPGNMQQPAQPQPGYLQPGQPQPPYPYMGPPGPTPPMNTLSIVAFILSFIIGPIGAILGHVSLSQIKKGFERGRGLAIAAAIIGWFYTAIWIISIGVMFMIMSTHVDNSFQGTQPSPPEPGISDTPSPDFCAVAAGFADIDPSNQEAITEKYRELAATRGDHPNADLYQSLFEAVQDGDQAKIDALQDDVERAADEDYLACVEAGY